MHRLLPILLLFAYACGGTPENRKNLPTQEEINRSMEDINRKFLHDEDRQIESFVERRNWPVTKTGTGLRYYIYENGDGDSAKSGNVVEIKYTLSLLNGTVVDSSASGKTSSFLVGHDNVESGLHEGITYLNEGSRAKLILPIHLAHGLIGDLKKIPPRSTLVYDIELVNVQ